MTQIEARAIELFENMSPYQLALELAKLQLRFVELPQQWYDQRHGEEIMAASEVIDALHKAGMDYV